MKIPEPRKLDSGNYFIRLMLNGETVCITRPSRKECIQEATLLKAEHKAGKAIQCLSNKTLNDAMESYISARSLRSPATIRGYRVIQRNRFQPVMNKPPKKIDWQSAIDLESRSVAPKTLHNAWGLIRSVLKEENIPIPKVNLPSKIKYDRTWLELDDIYKLLDIIKDNEYEVSILLALHSLRRSEILAMNYENIRNGIIRVRGSVVPDEHNQYVFKKQNKTFSSTRNIPIMIPRLAELCRGKSGKVFTHSADKLSNAIKQFCKRADIPEVTAHGLRHSFASLAFSDKVGMSEQEVMQLGGWSDRTVVHEIYEHTYRDERLKHQNKMAALFENIK